MTKMLEIEIRDSKDWYWSGKISLDNLLKLLAEADKLSDESMEAVSAVNDLQL